MKEIQIIKGCKKNERKAQKAFVEGFSPYIFTICKRYVIDDFAAQDCLQNSLVQVLTKINQYADTGSFKGWVSRVTVRKCLEYLRKNKRHIHSELEISEDPIICNGIHFKLELDEVMEFLNSLPYNYRMALNMYLVEGYSHKEIGYILGVTESASRSLVSRGRKMIVENFDTQRLNIVHKNISRDNHNDDRNLMINKL